MGYDAKALVVIGLKVDPEKMHKFLYKEIKVRSCSHIVDETKKCCPDCGKQIFSIKKEPHPEYDKDDQLFDFRLVSHSSEQRIPEYISALVVENGPYSRGSNRIPIEKLDELKTKMHNTLKDTGLWDEKYFGVWVVLYESC